MEEAQVKHERSPDWGLLHPEEDGADALASAPRNDPSLKSCRQQADQEDSDFHYNGNLLYKTWNDPSRYKTVEQLVLPTRYREVILRLSPSPSCRTSRKEEDNYPPERLIPLAKNLGRHCRHVPSLPNMPEDARRKMFKVPPTPLPIISRPFQRIAMDMIGPLTPTREGYRYILMVVDYATKYPEAVQCLGGVAFQMEHSRGNPHRCGSNFINKLMTHIYKLMGIHPMRASVYHPQTHSLVERFNQTPKSMIRKITDGVGG